MSEFKLGQRVVYPSHGVGEITGVEVQKIAGTEIEVYVISFPQEKMVLRVPVSRASTSGLRTLMTKDDVSQIYATLQTKAKQGNKMWSRRAQEYETKINSGNIVAVAEVVRDLYRAIESDRSYSERTIYESALNRLAGELSILENIPNSQAVIKLLDLLKEKAAA